MNVTHWVGNTPMIRSRYKLDGREGFVWAKLEAYNLSGSIKDRLADVYKRQEDCHQEVRGGCR